MRNKFSLLLLVTTIAITSNAQNAESNLTRWAEVNPIEKLYLHLDRETYFAGQTLWFKGYLMSEYVPSIKTSTVYVELLNNQSKIILRKVFPTYLGSIIGQLDIPDNITSGSYQLRAYSPLMLNQPGFLYSNRINIYGKEAKSQSQPQPKSLNIEFFPEGGNLITGLLNTVAFKATDENGLPVAVTGQLKNTKDEVIADVATLHDGMGSFIFIALENENFYVVTPSGQKFNLPASTKNGITFSVKNSARGKNFRIEYLPGNDTFKPAYMIGQMQNNIVFKQQFNFNQNTFGGSIDPKNMLSGILQITVFNKDGMPLAERLTFINNNEYILKGSLITDTLNYTARGRNHFTLSLPDTIIGNFSISVTDADFEDTPFRNQNIYSSFLLSNDLRGYIHKPAYYFLSTADSVKNALDLVMMTNGWTRFKWSEAAANSLPMPGFKDPGYISLKGKVLIEGTKKPFADKDLMMLLKPADTTKKGSMQLIHTNAEGNFKMDSLIFYDMANVMFSDIRGKKSKFIKVKMDADSINRNYTLQPLNIPYHATSRQEIEHKMIEAYNDYSKIQGLMLQGVTVRARAKSQTDKLDEKYTSSLFSGGISSRVLDLTNENVGGLNIFEYLQGRIAGLTVGRNAEGEYILSYRDGGMGGGNVTLYLDEIQTDANFIESIPTNQIAYVKLMNNFVGTFGGGTALAIYMKKGSELTASIDASNDIIKYNGYSIIKDFYSPNYSIRMAEHEKEDNRLTLLWNPNIYLAHVNPKVPLVFYNNDRTKKFKVVVEGIASDGRVLMIEKTIEGQ